MIDGKLKETKKKEHVFRDFGGINTQAYRTSIKGTEFSWLENLMPIGYGNIRAIPTVSAQQATIAPDVANYMKSANIGGVDYVFMFCNAGGAYQINATTFATTKFAPDGTLSTSGVQFDQWKNERIVIVDPVKGMFSWDGIKFTALNGQAQSAVMNVFGSGYFHRPIVVFSPVSGGSGATGTAIVGMGTIATASGGSGYAVGDVLTLVGGTFNAAAQLRVATVTGTAVASVTVNIIGDYTVAPPSPVSVSGGFGTGATFTVQWSVIQINITAGGAGYLSAPTISFTPTGGDTPSVVATATASVSVTPPAGTSVAVYAGRVWVANNRTVSFSAPGSYSDFTNGNAGGSFIVSDSTLHNTIIELISANNYLYIFGDDSINVVSDVRVSSGITLFSNTNLTAFVGSTYSFAVQPYLRGVFFMNQNGFYLLYGAVPQKVSEAMDGITSLIDFTKPITAGSVTIFNQLCMAFLFTYTGTTGSKVSPRKLFAIYFNGKWFLASQGDALTLSCSIFTAGKQQMMVTDGSLLYTAFNDKTSNINTFLQTKLWEFESSLIDKQALKAGFEFNSPVSQTYFSVKATVDSENQSNQFSFDTNNFVSFVNNSNKTVLWVNDFGSTVNWAHTGFTYIMKDVSNYGKYLGVSISSLNAGYQLNAIMMEYEDRARW